MRTHNDERFWEMYDALETISKMRLKNYHRGIWYEEDVLKLAENGLAAARGLPPPHDRDSFTPLTLDS